ncbi:hypothetical protein RO3G_16534 [Rhizopus delemar RA 99-880]|uniref:Uncharacterized protein n=1 Tax=Rhizopus delemar (strain RA 99-880 / ATCC MYA-4621 / FGSC 9543 / NRRL 43880) TaxID=246409 RepID=I1CTP3_RHIO9|nr:hypothetical protein RO3G_16534 [Rhizopus delemar RA 99-880]|eukprot:EIE91823.1 hypothetical protein RO3G_16534 [Rhizopus delemar RA 99-880]
MVLKKETKFSQKSDQRLQENFQLTVEILFFRHHPPLYLSASLLLPLPVHLLPLRRCNLNHLPNVPPHPPELESTPLQKPSKPKYAPSLPSQTAAARTFSPSSTNQGNRVLDIHYPDHHLVVLLIHNNYEAEVRSQLEKFEIPIHDDYDPLDPNNLRNPYYDDFDQDEKECAAWSVFTQRVIRAIRRLKGPVQRSVARFFVDKGIIASVVLNELFSVKQT